MRDNEILTEIEIVNVSVTPWGTEPTQGTEIMIDRKVHREITIGLLSGRDLLSRQNMKEKVASQAEMSAREERKLLRISISIEWDSVDPDLEVSLHPEKQGRQAVLNLHLIVVSQISAPADLARTKEHLVLKEQEIVKLTESEPRLTTTKVAAKTWRTLRLTKVTNHFFSHIYITTVYHLLLTCLSI